VIHCMMTAICSCELWDLLVQVWVGLSILCGYLEKESLDHLPMLFWPRKGHRSKRGAKVYAVSVLVGASCVF
jgi:hypothetical protein